MPEQQHLVQSIHLPELLQVLGLLQVVVPSGAAQTTQLPVVWPCARPLSPHSDALDCDRLEATVQTAYHRPGLMQVMLRRSSATMQSLL